MRLPRIVTAHLDKARTSATAAVEVYNRPGGHFRTPHYLILMIIAWGALFHAIFHQRGIKPWYVKSGSGRGVRYKKVEGEPKHWEISECVRQYYRDRNPPERSNLEFLIGLRNKIEHRHLPNLDPALYGECQAALMNFERLLTKEFGARYALAETLAVSLQFSQVSPEARARAIRELGARAASGIRDYIDRFRAALSDEVLNSSAFSFRVFLIPKTANRQKTADIAVEFIPYDSQNPEQMREMEKLTAMIKEKHIRVSGLGLMKPGQVIERVQTDIPYAMNQHVHARCWKHFNVRPSAKSKDPHKTDDRYCIYDEPHGDYLYTDAWVRKLVKALSARETYREITGKEPA